MNMPEQYTACEQAETEVPLVELVERYESLKHVSGPSRPGNPHDHLSAADLDRALVELVRHADADGSGFIHLSRLGAMSGLCTSHAGRAATCLHIRRNLERCVLCEDREYLTYRLNVEMVFASLERSASAGVAS